MRHCCIEIGVATTPKHAKVIIGGLSTIEGKEWRGEGKCFSGVTVEEIRGGVESLNPVRRRYTSLKKERAHNIISGADNAFSLAILWRSVGARHAHSDAMGKKEHAGGGVVKLSAVVALDALNGGAKLRRDKGKKLSESRESVRFQPQRESLEVMGTIIKNNKVILVT